MLSNEIYNGKNKMENFQVDFYEKFEDFYTEIPLEAEKNVLNSPFQYKSWQEKIYAEHKAIKSKELYVGAVLRQNNKPILGGHFFVKKRGKHKGIFLLGSGGETDYFDLIYFCDEVKVEHINELLKQTVKHVNSVQLIFIQIPGESPLARWAREKGFPPYFVNECAEICLSGTYVEYFSSLSKHIRQNVRTANNRLKRDNLDSTIQIYDEKPISANVIQELLLLYEMRRVVKNNINGLAGIKYLIYEKIRKEHKKKYNLIAEAMRSMTGKFLAVYRIDEVIVAYCFGLKSKYSNRVCIMQVAINDAYGKYSPGILMLITVFQYLLDDPSNVPLLFDLTNGNEKYKFSLGATSHFTNYYKISLHE